MQIESINHRDSKWTGALPVHLDSPDTLVLAFGASQLADDPRPLQELRAALPQSQIVGCSTSGQILASDILDDALTATVVRFDRSRLRVAEIDLADQGLSHVAGQTLARQLDDKDLRGVLVLSDGLTVNGSELARGFVQVLTDRVPVTGGLAGDGDRFARTWVANGDSARPHRVTAVGFYGDHLSFRHGSKGGWDPFGPERRITRSKGNVLYELDRQPALTLYRTYLGDRAAGLPATALLFPLAIRNDRNSERRLVRTILGVDDRELSMTFAGDVPEGSYAQLMGANFDRLVEGASHAAQSARGPGTTPGLDIAISCVGRRLVLGERAEEEIEATLESLPSGSHLVGFYSYGELAPTGGGTCDLHNQTMTLTHLTES